MPEPSGSSLDDSQKTKRQLMQELAEMRARLASMSASSPEETGRHVERAVRSMPVGVTICDLQGVIVYTNPADAAIHGFTVDELLGQDIEVFAPKGSRRPLSTHQLQELKTWRREATNVRRDGSEFPVLLTSDVVTDSDGNPIGLSTSCQDLSHRKDTEAALWHSQERYALTAAAAHDGLWDWDLAAGSIEFSARWKDMLGYADFEIGDSPGEWFDRVEPDSREALQQALQAHLDGETPSFECEYAIRHKDGTLRWMLSRGLASRGADGAAYHMAGTQTDITERKVFQNRRLQEAVHDPLTGLPNKALFKHLTQHAMHRARQGDGTSAVLLLDIDRFRSINDSLGHDAADELILAFARRLKTCVGPEDIVARVGGNQFAILLQTIEGVSSAVRTAQTVRHQASQAFYLDVQRVFPPVTIGIVIDAGRYTEPGELLRDASTALSHARTAGRVGYQVFVPAMRQAVVERMQLETDLRCALERREFMVHYQPIVSLVDGRISGFEALVRWQHPTKGLIAPDEFIPLAEETGLIVPLGWWVLHQACRQMREWHQQFPAEERLTLSVNLSAIQFMEPDIVDRVGAILDATGLEPTTLNLEITETMLVRSGQPDFPVFTALRELNVCVHMDDFGTGYSSLSHLRKFPVDALKIDRSFVTDMGVQCEDPEIVRCIIGLARDLEIKVVAEGVTTMEQADLLRDLWCQYGQGFYFSCPVEPSAATELLRDGRPLPQRQTGNADADSVDKAAAHLKRVS